MWTLNRPMETAIFFRLNWQYLLLFWISSNHFAVEKSRISDIIQENIYISLYIYMCFTVIGEKQIHMIYDSTHST